MKRILGMGMALAMAAAVVLPAWANAQEYYASPCQEYNCKAQCPGQSCVLSILGKNVKIGKGRIYTWQGFPGPCATPANSLLLIEKQAPDEVMLGDEVTYQIQISNRSNDLLRGSTITETLPEGVEFVKAEPEAAVNGKTLTWNLGDMPAKTAKLLCVTVTTSQLGCLTIKSNAQVCVAIDNPIVLNVLECGVAIQKWMPECVEGCDPFPVKICVKNPGTAVARNICVTDNLPAGLTEVKTGKSELSWKIDSLAPGAVKEIVFMVCAASGGTYTNIATATADRCQGISAVATTKVQAPSLQVVKSGPSKAYIGMPVVYDITVSNYGDGVARDVRVVDSWTGAKANFLAASEKVSGGKNNSFAWSVGDLLPGESRTLKVELCSLEIGTICNQASATLNCRCQCEPKIAVVQTEVLGVAGVLSGLSDNMDAIPLECNVIYTIEAKNQGTKATTNLRYTATLDDGMEFVSATGPTDVTADGKTLTFAPLAQLDGKKTATWTVTVKAKTEGDKRFVTSLLTDQLDANRPVMNAESTTFYAQDTVTSSSN